jgi:sialic acid synthase SpsE
MTEGLTLGRVTVGHGQPVVVIAEAACEHLGSLERAMQLVDAARRAGANVVKFQLHVPEEMVPGSIRFWGGSMDEVLERYELGVDGHAALTRYCDEVGIQYLCTPFSAKAAEILDRLGVDGFKTGSGELTNLPMQRTIARTRKPLIVSTGMATIGEIDETVALHRAEGSQFMLTHCTSAYPPPYEEINLRFIPVLAERYGVLVGHSDHTPEPWTALGAVALGAPLIEKHLTLSRSLRGPDHPVSLEPDEFRQLVDAVRKLERALGAEKKVHEDEQVVRAWAHHSIVAARDIVAGETLDDGAIAV